MLGVGGIFSLAQMALFACGAYATAMLGYYCGWPLWLAMPAGRSRHGGCISMLIGFACLRLHGPYVALLTLAIAQVLYLMIINDTDCFTTAALGLHAAVWRRARHHQVRRSRLSRPAAAPNSTSPTTSWRCSCWLLAIAVLDRHHPRPIGPRVPGAARQSRLCVVARHQPLQVPALAVRAVGLLHRPRRRRLCRQFPRRRPDVFSITLLLFLLSMIVVGGLGTIWGPLLGAAALMLVDEGMKEFQAWRALGMGLVLPICVILLPGGVVGAFKERRSAIKNGSARDAELRIRDIAASSDDRDDGTLDTDPSGIGLASNPEASGRR